MVFFHQTVGRAPHFVVLLNEIEKAHRDVLNVLLQVMEDGILTGGKGRTENCLLQKCDINHDIQRR